MKVLKGGINILDNNYLWDGRDDRVKVFLMFRSIRVERKISIIFSLNVKLRINIKSLRVIIKRRKIKDNYKKGKE